MALVTTTNTAAIGAGDTSFVVASATGFAAGYIVQVGDEKMRVSGGYTSGTTIPVIRGQEGTRAVAHGITTLVVCGTGADWAEGGPSTPVTYPLAGRARVITTYGADGAITLPPAGSDAVAVLNGTTQWDMTVAVPTKDLNGSLLWIATDGGAAHTVTFTGGLSGASTSYDVVTINATAPVLLGPFMAMNSLWLMAVAVPLAGTVTNLTATVA